MASDIPVQFAGHQFADKPPADHICEWCGADFFEVKALHRFGGLNASLCPHFGPQDPIERAAFLQQQADRDRQANIAHGGHP